MKFPYKVIKADVALPRSFTVIEASSHREAVVNMRKAFANPVTRLVVWNGAAALMSDEAKHAIAMLKGLKYREFRVDKKIDGTIPHILGRLSPDRFGLKASLNEHFNDIAGKLDIHPRLLEPLQEQSLLFSSAMSEVLGATSSFADFRSETARARPALHFHNELSARDVLALRVLFGKRTVHFDEDDVISVKPVKMHAGGVIDDIRLKPDAQPWITEEGDIVFLSSQALHTAPWGSLRSTNGKRMIQTYQVKARDNFVAGPLLTL